MTEDRYRRETGRRTARIAEERPETDTEAALPRKPRPYGLTEAVDETQDKTRRSEGTNPPRR